MKVGSLFSGIGGFDRGFDQAGFTCSWQVEIDADCNRVLEKHWPGVTRYKDVRDVGKHNLEPVDVIAFGWPCQDLSVAGLRAGISGERSGLFREAARVIQELRPKWIVAENVPGLFSSYTPIDAPPSDVAIGTEWEVEEDSDFEHVLATLDELGYCVSWRVCDAQFWNVAQRRERVFLVGSLGSLGSIEVFPFAESLPGDFETRREAGAGVTRTISGGAHPGGHNGQDDMSVIPVAATLDQRGRGPTDAVMMNLQVARPLANSRTTNHYDESQQTYVTHALRSEGADASEDGTGRGTPIIPIDMRQASRGAKMTNNRPNGSSGGAPGTGIGNAGDPCPTIADSHVPAVFGVANCFNGYTGSADDNDAQANHIVSVDLQNTRLGGDIAGSLDTTRPSRGGGQAVIAFSSKDHGADAGEIAPTLRSQNFKDSHINGGGQVAIAFDWQAGDGGNDESFRGKSRSYIVRKGEYAQLRSNARDAVQGNFGVRRLTPRECERLMGLPDDYTRWDAEGKEISDSARYRMLGNSIVIPVAKWIGERLMKA